ncbi:zinc-ribbon domain-containing protein [Desulfitobacterium sp. Sab5]|uniref:zinc-ribbon domain-containing protein n=1 Tax=Desulfitobacterium nosdiversum TaxID=3375356 RepID=UPI003CEEF60F
MPLCYSCSDCGRCKNLYNQIIKCPKCGSSNLRDKKICKKCGAVLELNKVVNNQNMTAVQPIHSNR